MNTDKTILLSVLLISFMRMTAVGAYAGEERSFMETIIRNVRQPSESRGGELETAGKPERLLTDGNPDTGVAWRDGIDDFPAMLDFDLSEPVSVDTVVCRWKWMPSDYLLECRVDGEWTNLCSVTDNIVLGPRIKLHMFSPVVTDCLRLRITGTVTNDCHGRMPGKTTLCALSDIEIYWRDRLPAYMEDFLARNPMGRSGQEEFTPDASWIDTEIPTWQPIVSEEYRFSEKGKEVNEKASLCGQLLNNCSQAYASTGDERYAEKAREVMLSVIDHYDRYQGSRFLGIDWKAVTYQEPAYRMTMMNRAYGLIASSPCMTREDKLRFVFFSLDNAEFQYRAIRDRFVGQENWSANSVGELVMTAYFFREFQGASRWVKLADAKVGDCFRGFMKDGFWRECSPSHGLYMLRGLSKYGIGKHLLGDPIWKKTYCGHSLESLFEALAKTATPFGEYPSVNDSNGNDRPLLDEGEESRDALYLMGRGDLLKMLKDSGVPPKIPGASIPSVTFRDPPYCSVLLPDAGLAVMRDGWERDDAYLLMDFGPHGGGHGHPDKLSIIMFADGHHWIPDAACSPHYCIFPEQKTWHKQTVAHNTVLVDNESQERCTGELLFWNTCDEVDIVSATHREGYPGVIHRRTVVHPRNGYFVVHDTLQSEREKSSELDWLLHVYGHLESHGDGKLCFRNKNGDKGLLVLSDDIGGEQPPMQQGLCGGLERSPEWRNEEYPEKGEPGWIYIPYFSLPGRLSSENGLKEYFVVIYPFTGEEPDVAIRAISDKAGLASGVCVSHAGKEDVFVEAALDYRAEQGPYQCEGFKESAKALFERRSNGKPVFEKKY